MDCLLRSFGVTKKVQVKNLVDIWKIYKKIFPKQKYSSLAFISKSILGKEICKEQTLTNWKLRPLRDNQMHYAAMDAFVVLKIYDKLMEGYSQIITYFLEMEEEEL